MQNDILFDNIYIGHSIEDAEALRKETFDVKKPIELAEEEAQKPKPEDKPQTSVSFKEDPITYVREKVDLFVIVAKQDPIQAVKLVPEVAGVLGALLFASILFVVGAISASSPAPAAKAAAQKGKEAASAAKEKAAEAVSSAADTAKGAATKRTTRSSAE
jgi:calnexin